MTHTTTLHNTDLGTIGRGISGDDGLRILSPMMHVHEDRVPSRGKICMAVLLPQVLAENRNQNPRIQKQEEEKRNSLVARTCEKGQGATNVPRETRWMGAAGNNSNRLTIVMI